LGFIAEELAISDSPQRCALELSEVLTRVVQLGIEAAPGIERFIHDPHFSQCSFHEILQLVVSPTGRAVTLPAELEEGLPNLFKSYANRHTAPFYDILVRVPAARIFHADLVLGAYVPGDAWREVGLGEFPNPLTWATSGGHSIIANVQIGRRIFTPKEKDFPQKGELAIFQGLPKGARRWMGLPEIEVMSKLYELKAEKVFHCEEIVPAGATMKIPPPIFSPVARASISAGLLAESFLHAAGSPAPVFSAGDNGKLESSSYSIRAAWVNSRARANMIQAAVDLSHSRVSVLGAGMSHIHVATQKARLKSFRFGVAANTRLSYPTGVRATEEKFRPKSTAVFSNETAQEWEP